MSNKTFVIVEHFDSETKANAALTHSAERAMVLAAQALVPFLRARSHSSMVWVEVWQDEDILGTFEFSVSTTLAWMHNLSVANEGMVQASLHNRVAGVSLEKERCQTLLAQLSDLDEQQKDAFAAGGIIGLLDISS